MIGAGEGVPGQYPVRLVPATDKALTDKPASLDTPRWHHGHAADHGGSTVRHACTKLVRTRIWCTRGCESERKDDDAHDENGWRSLDALQASGISLETSRFPALVPSLLCIGSATYILNVPYFSPTRHREIKK